jgi:hypothetical protein
LSNLAPVGNLSPANPAAGLPDSWSESVKATYSEIESDNPGLDAASLAALYEACELFAVADTMQRRVDTDGLLVTGSQGQLVAHPLIAEVRQSRSKGLDALTRLGLARNQSNASRAGAALASKRHHGSTPGVRRAV